MSGAAGEILPRGLKIGHGLGSVAMGVKETGLTTFFMLYYNQVLGYDPRLISLVLIIAMLVDAMVDPLIGRLSDATRTRWGRRLPWLYVSALPLAISWVLLWTYREPADQSVILLALNVIAVRVFVSACEIPAASLTAELTQDYDERTSLTRYRFLFGWSGGLLTTALAYGYFLASDGSEGSGLLNPQGYEAFGLFGAGLLLVSTILSAMAQHKRVVVLPPRAVPTNGHNLITDMYRAFRNRAFKPLAAAALFIIATYGVTIASVNYMMLYVWRITDQQIALYPLGLAVAVVAAFLATSPLHRRYGKKQVGIVSAFLSTVLTLLTYSARNFGIWPELGTDISAALLLFCVTVALFFQIVTTISASSMVGEIVEDHEAQYGERAEGVFYAGYLMVQKFAQAFAIFLVGQMISVAGLGGQVSPDAISAETANNMGWAFTGLLAFLTWGAIAALRRYPIDRADHEARVAAMQQRAQLPNQQG